MSVLHEYAKQYEIFCSKLAYSISANISGTSVISASTPGQANKDCYNRRAGLPEIRSAMDEMQLISLMQQHNIQETIAGIKLIGKEMRYYSDNTRSISPTIEDCRLCDKAPLTYYDDTFLYDDNNTHTPTFTRADPKEHIFYYTKLPHIARIQLRRRIGYPSMPGPVLCIPTNKFALDTSLTQVVSSSCARDMEKIGTANELIQGELDEFTAEPNRAQRKEALFRRQKRALPLLPLMIGAGAGGLMSSVFNRGSSPFAWIGRPIASLFGLATQHDMQMTREYINRHAYAIEALQINQQTLVRAIQLSTREIDKLKSQMHELKYATTLAYMEMDNKAGIRHLQDAIQITLLKLQTAVNAATNQLSSPYIFGSVELQQLAMKFAKAQNVHITTEINDIVTQVAMVDGTLTFMYAVPIKSSENRFQFYELYPLPLFKDGKRYDIVTSNQFMAINPNRNEYAEVSSIEFQKCTQTPLCILTRPVVNIDLGPCEVRTLKYNKQLCQMIETDEKQVPAFINFGNQTFYSVENETTIHLSCSDMSTYRTDPYTEHKTIQGTGSFSVPTGCNIQIGPGAYIKPPHIISRHSLDHNNIFKVIEQPQRGIHLFPTTTTPQSTSSTELSLLHITSFRDATNVIFNKESTLSEIIRILVYIAFLTFISLFLCCLSQRFRYWLAGCCFLQKPDKHFTQLGYQCPKYTRAPLVNPSDTPQNMLAVTHEPPEEITTGRPPSLPTSTPPQTPKHKRSEDYESQHTHPTADEINDYITHLKIENEKPKGKLHSSHLLSKLSNMESYLTRENLIADSVWPRDPTRATAPAAH